MSLNTPDNTNSSSWNNPAADDQPQASNTSGYVGGTVSAGLGQLFGMASMTADNRNVKEVGETREALQKKYDDLKRSTTSEIQQAIIPTIEVLTSSVSPQLPGLGFFRQFGDTLYIAAALFYNRNMSIGSERVNINTGMNMAQSLSIPLTPAQVAQGQFVNKLKEHYQRVAESKQAKHVQVINIVVVDLEMFAHPEAGEPKDYPEAISTYLATEWEEAIMVKTASEMTLMGKSIPSPFITKETPYGKENCAEARVTAISGRVNKAKHLTSSNIEVVVSTINNPANPAAFQANSREVARATGSVSLVGVTWEEHVRMMQSQNAQHNNSLIQNLMGIGQSNYPSGYRPLRPVIALDTSQPGEMMGNNGGLHSYLFGLYTLLATNTQYVFMEGLRKASVGARGNLSSLEVRIDQLLKGVPAAGNPTRIKLDDKNIHDTDVLNVWIRQNVSPHATFQAIINPAGANSAVNNFLARLMDTSNNVNEVKTLINTLDSLSGGRFTTLLQENQKLNNGQGWNVTKPALIPTGIIGINGLATLGDRKLNPLELDEMMACTLKGKNIAAIEALLATMYGTVQGESLKQRTQKLRVEAASSIFDGALHINNFSISAIWHPELMALIGKSMDGIGQLHVANNLGSWRSNQTVFAPGVNLATQVSAGSNIGGALSGGLGFTTFG